MVEQVNEEPGNAESSHQADVAEGFPDDDRNDLGRSGFAGSGTRAGAATDTSHEADITAGYDDPDDSPVVDPET